MLRANLILYLISCCMYVLRGYSLRMKHFLELSLILKALKSKEFSRASITFQDRKMSICLNVGLLRMPETKIKALLYVYAVFLRFRRFQSCQKRKRKDFRGSCLDYERSCKKIIFIGCCFFAFTVFLVFTSTDHVPGGLKKSA